MGCCCAMGCGTVCVCVGVARGRGVCVCAWVGRELLLSGARDMVAILGTGGVLRGREEWSRG